MARFLSQKAIYKKVGCSDFSALTSEQLKIFVSILHRIEPDTAISLMNHFSDFRMSANKMTGFLRIKVQTNHRFKKKYYEEIQQQCYSILNTLDSLLMQQDFSSADRLYIEDRLITLACLLQATERKRSKKAIKVLGLVAAGVLTAAGALLLLILLASDTDESKSDEKTDPHDNDEDDNNSFGPDSELNNPFYEPFADPENPLYIGPFDEDDSDYDFEEDEDELEDDESYAAEEYLSSRPWGYDNDGY